jgi:acyl dehydratase
MGINYGCDKVRFPSPVPVGSRLRAGVELLELTPGPAGTRVKVRVTVEREGGDKPACVAESLSLLVA